MSFSQQAWQQLKNITADELIAALKKDKWVCDTKGGSQHIYLSPNGDRVSVHYHPQKTFGPKLLQALLADTKWDEKRMRELKLIK